MPLYDFSCQFFLVVYKEDIRYDSLVREVSTREEEADLRIRGVCLKEIADQRHNLHKNHASSRPLSEDYEYIGLIGEGKFELTYGYAMDLEQRPGGDSRVDFHTPLATIDVKTARKAYNLLREVGKPHAELLILAEYLPDTDDVRFLGWEWDCNMIQCPSKDFGYGIINHYKHWSELKRMETFEHLLKTAEEAGKRV